MDIDTDKARLIANYLLIDKTEIKRADICLIFGNKFICEQQAAQAAALYHKGFFKQVVTTGGIPTDDGRCEAVRTRDEMVKLGVPDSAILVDDQSTNTQENIENAQALLRIYNSFDSTNAVLSIGHVAAGRRFLMTMARRWPEVLSMHVSINPYGVAIRDWDTHPDFKAKVLKEWDKIPAYMNAGYLREVSIDRLNQTIINVRAQEEALDKARKAPAPQRAPQPGL